MIRQPERCGFLLDRRDLRSLNLDELCRLIVHCADRHFGDENGRHHVDRVRLITIPLSDRQSSLLRHSTVL